MLRYAQHDEVLPVPVDPSHFLLIQSERHWSAGQHFSVQVFPT